MRLLGVSGSLRSESSNSRLLAAASQCAPKGVKFEITDCIGQLPHFNPDIDVESTDTVAAWVQQVRISDGLVISSPEYARGYPGSLKNALDWLVQSDAHIDKPFMLLNASDRSTVARDSLKVVLQTMSGIHVEDASLTIGLLGKSLTVTELLSDSAVEEALQGALIAFADRIRQLKADSPAGLV